MRVADDQHADHQFGIDRGAPRLAVEGTQLFAQARQIDEPIDRPQQVIGGNVPLQAELIKQLLLNHRPLTHHQHLSRCNANAESDQSHDLKREFFHNRPIADTHPN